MIIIGNNDLLTIIHKSEKGRKKNGYFAELKKAKLFLPQVGQSIVVAFAFFRGYRRVLFAKDNTMLVDIEQPCLAKY